MVGDKVSVHLRRNPRRSRSVGANIPPGIENSLPPLIPSNTAKIEQSQSMMSFRLINALLLSIRYCIAVIILAGLKWTEIKAASSAAI